MHADFQKRKTVVFLHCSSPSAWSFVEGVMRSTYTTTLAVLPVPKALFKVWQYLIFSFRLPLEIRSDYKNIRYCFFLKNLPALVFRVKTLKPV